MKTKLIILILVVLSFILFFIAPTHVRYTSNDTGKKETSSGPQTKILQTVLNQCPLEIQKALMKPNRQYSAFIYFENHDLHYQYYIEDFLDEHVTIIRPSGEPFYVLIDSLLENDESRQTPLNWLLSNDAFRHLKKGSTKLMLASKIHFVQPNELSVDYNRFKTNSVEHL